MKNTREEKEALLTKLRGKNGLARDFCVFPYSQKLVDNLHQEMDPFMRPYETEGGKFLIALNVCQSDCQRACNNAGTESFVIVKPSYEAIRADFFTRQMVPFNGMYDKYRWFRVDSSEEVFHNSIDSKHIYVKGMMFDLTVPLDVYLDCVKDIDDFIEIREKNFEYGLDVLKNEYFYYNTDPALGMSWYNGKLRLIGDFRTEFWKNKENNETL